MQLFISQASDKLDGTYHVARWNITKQYCVVIESGFLTEDDAKDRALMLNKDAKMTE